MRQGTTAWKFANFVGLQVAWFACVLGAAHDFAGAGCVAALALVALHFALLRDRRPDAILAVSAIGIGAVYETLNRGTAVYSVTSDVFPAPAPPAWLLVLWIAFALAIRHSMAWMRGRYVVAAILGAIAGPLSWRGGEKLGAVTFGGHVFGGMESPWWLTLGVEWGIAMPLLLFIAARAETLAGSGAEPAPDSATSRPAA